MKSMVKRSMYSDHLGRVAILKYMRSMIRSVIKRISLFFLIMMKLNTKPDFL